MVCHDHRSVCGDRKIAEEVSHGGDTIDASEDDRWFVGEVGAEGVADLKFVTDRS